jgi:hypothetical protein
MAARRVGEILVGPHMHVAVHVADFGRGVENRLAQMLGLRPVAELLVDLQVRLDGPGLQRVGAMVEDHPTFPPWGLLFQ